MPRLRVPIPKYNVNGIDLYDQDVIIIPFPGGLEMLYIDGELVRFYTDWILGQPGTIQSFSHFQRYAAEAVFCVLRNGIIIPHISEIMSSRIKMRLATIDHYRPENIRLCLD